MEFNNVNLEKGYKKTKRKVILGILCLAASLLFLVLAFVKLANASNNVEEFNQILFEKNRDDRIAYLDVNGYAYLGTESDYKHFFLTINNANYYNIISLYEHEYDEILDELDALPENECLRLYGYTRPVTSELKEYAIEEINAIFEDDTLNSANFEDYIGAYYLEGTKNNKVSGLGAIFQVSLDQLLIAALALIFGLIILIPSLKAKESFGDSIVAAWPNRTEYENELNDPSTIWIEGLKTYLTDIHLISIGDELNIYDYQDIVLAYPTRYSYNGVPSYNVLTIGDKTGQIKEISKGKIQTENLHSQVLDTIAEKNPNCVIGYSLENLQQYHLTYNTKKK